MCPDCMSCDMSIIYFHAYSALLYALAMERPAEANSNAMPSVLPATSGTTVVSGVDGSLFG